MVLNREEM